MQKMLRGINQFLKNTTPGASKNIFIPYSEINKIYTSYGWKFFKEETCIENIISVGYNFRHKEFARLYQFIKTFLFAPSSGLYGCPNSMTDGAEYLIKLIEEDYSKYFSGNMKLAYNSIITNNPKWFWTSGQWVRNYLL